MLKKLLLDSELFSLGNSMTGMLYLRGKRVLLIRGGI